MCTKEQFIEQYNPIKLELGKTYLQESSSWAKKHYKIVIVRPLYRLKEEVV